MEVVGAEDLGTVLAADFTPRVGAILAASNHIGFCQPWGGEAPHDAAPGRHAGVFDDIKASWRCWTRFPWT